MSRYFSPSTGTFFDEAIHGFLEIDAERTPGQVAAGKRPKRIPNPDRTIPADAVKVADGDYSALLEAQAKGKVIIARGGRPIAVDASPADPETQRAIIRARRKRLLEATDKAMASDYPITEGEREELLAYRATLRDVTDALDPADPLGSVVWPEVPGFL